MFKKNWSPTYFFVFDSNSLTYINFKIIFQAISFPSKSLRICCNSLLIDKKTHFCVNIIVRENVYLYIFSCRVSRTFAIYLTDFFRNTTNFWLSSLHFLQLSFQLILVEYFASWASLKSSESSGSLLVYTSSVMSFSSSIVKIVRFGCGLFPPIWNMWNTWQ